MVHLNLPGLNPDDHWSRKWPVLELVKRKWGILENASIELRAVLTDPKSSNAVDFGPCVSGHYSKYRIHSRHFVDTAPPTRRDLPQKGVGCSQNGLCGLFSPFPTRCWEFMRKLSLIHQFFWKDGIIPTPELFLFFTFDERYFRSEAKEAVFTSRRKKSYWPIVN